MDMRGENAEYVGITKDGVAFLERPVNDSGCCRYMSPFGPERTSLVTPHMSAFGAKADIPSCTAHVGDYCRSTPEVYWT
jgi:hypothetical protein